MWRLVDKNPSASISWYLMTSWLHYVHDISVIPDDDFNELCLRLIEVWPSIDHRHKHLVDLDSLRAGTGFAIRDYPSIVQSAGKRIAIEDKHLKYHPQVGRWVPRH